MYGSRHPFQALDAGMLSGDCTAGFLLLAGVLVGGFVMVSSVVGLCGQGQCHRLCMRSEHCSVGLARSRRLLAAQAVRRFQRRALLREGGKS